jgi:hypothetical protein
MNIMDKQKKLKIYDSIVATIGIIAIIAALLSSCTTHRGAGYQDHLRTTHTNNWVHRDNGGCGWAN